MTNKEKSYEQDYNKINFFSNFVLSKVVLGFIILMPCN